MLTYYEILKVLPTATTAEIQSAYEAQYAQLERFANHPDAQTVGRARQGLQFLQQVFATLSDTEKRKAYDASMGLLAGLADPQAVPKPSVPVPPASVLPPTPVVEASVDAWVCPACRTHSPIGSRFCKSCGQTLAHECPQCDELVETAATFCSACGFDLNSYTPPLKLHTELVTVDDKLTAQIAQQLEKAALSEWRQANLMTEEVSAAVKRGLVIPLGMVKKAFTAQFSLSVQCEQPVKVQIASDRAWLTVDQSSLSLDAGQTQTVKIKLDAGNLEGGQFYTGSIIITTPGINPTTVKHYVMFGIKKFLGAGGAKNELKSTLPAQLDSIVLGPAYVESMFHEARQAKIDGDIGKSAAAYANAIRFMANPRTDPDIIMSPYRATTPQIAALSQRWHRLVCSLADEVEKSTSDPDLLNWSPQVRWDETISFHLLPLWQIKKEDPLTSVGDSQGKMLHRLNAEFAADYLTGELLRSHLPMRTANKISSSYNTVLEKISSGDFIVQKDRQYWIAKMDERQLWKFKETGHSAVVIGQHRVYLYNGSHIVALDKMSGREIWERDFDFGRLVCHNHRFVEVFGVLLTMYITFLSAGSESDDYYYIQHFVWWNAETGTPMGEAQFPIGKGKSTRDFHVCYAVAPLAFQVMRVIVAYESHIYDTVLLGYQATSDISFLKWGKNWTKAGACIFEEHPMSSSVGYVKVTHLHMLGKHNCLAILSNPGVFSEKRYATILDLQIQQGATHLCPVDFWGGCNVSVIGGVLILHPDREDSQNEAYAFV